MEAFKNTMMSFALSMGKVFFLFAIFILLACPAPSFAIDVDSSIPVRVRYLYSIDAKASGTALGSASIIQVDNDNKEIFILDLPNRRVIITDIEGTFMFQFSFAMAGIRSPDDMAIGKDGKFYFADGNKLVIVDYDGRFVKNLDISNVPEGKGGQKVSFQSVAVNDNYIYVGDSLGKRILLFSRATNEYITEYKEGLGQNFVLALDSDSLYVLDATAFSVYNIDLDGNPIGRFGKISGLAGGFSMPAGIDVDSAGGRIAVVDMNRLAIVYFDREGNFLYEFGGSDIFSWPSEVALDSRGRVYVGDASGLVRVFAIIEESIE